MLLCMLTRTPTLKNLSTIKFTECMRAPWIWHKVYIRPKFPNQMWESLQSNYRLSKLKSQEQEWGNEICKGYRRPHKRQPDSDSAEVHEQSWSEAQAGKYRPIPPMSAEEHWSQVSEAIKTTASQYLGKLHSDIWNHGLTRQVRKHL